MPLICSTLQPDRDWNAGQRRWLDLGAPALFIFGRRSVEGCYSGTSIDSQETLLFRVLSGVRLMNEAFPLDRAAEAYERMVSGKARFRVVLTTGN